MQLGRFVSHCGPSFSFWLIVGVLATLSGPVASAEAKPNWNQFSKVGGWEILKKPSGCIAATRSLKDVLGLMVGKDRGVVFLANNEMNIPAGIYPIGFKLGPPSGFDGTVQAVVTANATDTVNIVFSLPEFMNVAKAGWVEFTLGSHKHFVNSGRGLDAVRLLRVCEATASDPFKNAGGGLLP